MEMKRRDFVRMAGLGAAAAGLTGGVAAVAKGESAAHAASASGASGKGYAMVVDIEKCRQQEGCTKCRDACNLAHNVPVIDNPKHTMKWIWKEPFEHALEELTHEHTPESVIETKIPVLCNHCDNPPCTRVCPTGATWKRASDGIVMMDWHRCIGCRYCMAACPYGSRSFNWREPRALLEEINEDFPTRTLGVVEKCNFCEERLAEGKPPACVEACPAGALTFGDPDDPESAVRKLLESKFTVRRKAELGTRPQVYYVV